MPHFTTFDNFASKAIVHPQYQPEADGFMKLDDIKGEMLFNFAEVDHAVPDEDVKNLRKALKGSKCKATVKVYKDTVHGFQFSERDPYHPVASEQAWDAIFALWKRNLKKRK